MDESYKGFVNPNLHKSMHHTTKNQTRPKTLRWLTPPTPGPREELFSLSVRLHCFLQNPQELYLQNSAQAPLVQKKTQKRTETALAAMLQQRSPLKGG